MKNNKIKNFIKLIHIAKNELNLSDAEYRKILAEENIKSCSEIKTEEKAVAVFSRFKKLGFIPASKNNRFKNTQKGGGYNRLTARQEYYIRGLWNLCMKNNTSEESLNVFCHRITGVANITWLTKKDARDVITALRAIAEDKGFAPDKKPVS